MYRTQDIVGLMGNIVDGIQRPLRVSHLMSSSHRLIRLHGHLVHPRTFKVHLYSTWYQYRSAGSLPQVGFRPSIL